MNILPFTSFIKINKKQELSYESVYKKVIIESKRFKKQFINDFYSNKPIIFEDVESLFNSELNQTKQDTKAMDQFVQEYKALSPEEQVQLVDKLNKPLPGSKYIENNNEIKLILIYKTDKNSEAGQKAFEDIILNKQKWFETIAGIKARKRQLPMDKVGDYAQDMTLTLLGGGKYNEKNGGKYSLDAYDPYSGVPFNAFVNTYIINSAGNKYNARFNSSIATDYNGEKMQVSSTDITTSNSKGDQGDAIIDMIPDTNGDLPGDNMDDNEQKALLIKFLKSGQLKQQEKKALCYRYLIKGLFPDVDQNIKKYEAKLMELGKPDTEMTFRDIGIYMGYSEKTAITNARRWLLPAESKVKAFAQEYLKNHKQN